MSPSHLRHIESGIEKARQRLDEKRIAECIRYENYTGWRPQPHEHVDRLGWLDLARQTPVDEEQPVWPKALVFSL